MKSSQHEFQVQGIDFRNKQREFAAFIRDPENNHPPADVNKKRMLMYRELFFNNIQSFLAGNFPVIRALLNDEQWDELVQDFYSRHTSRSPYFSQIPEEFIEFLENERQSDRDFPFLLELAHYEWVEMALSIAREECVVNTGFTDNLAEKLIRLSPLAWILAYQFPVHKISPEYLPMDCPETPSFLVVYRDCMDVVNFIEITPVTYRLLEIIQDNEVMVVNDLIIQIVKECTFLNAEIVKSGAFDILEELLEKTVISVIAGD